MSGKQDLAELLTQVGLFSRCTKRERQTIARHAQAAELPAGTDLVREGEPGDALFLILEGEAVVQRDGHVVGRVGPGSHFGELAILDGAPAARRSWPRPMSGSRSSGSACSAPCCASSPSWRSSCSIGLAGELRKAQAQVQEASFPTRPSDRMGQA